MLSRAADDQSKPIVPNLRNRKRGEDNLCGKPDRSRNRLIARNVLGSGLSEYEHGQTDFRGHQDHESHRAHLQIGQELRGT